MVFAGAEVVVLHMDVVVVVARAGSCAKSLQILFDATRRPLVRRRRSRTPGTTAQVDVVLVPNGRDHERHGAGR